jgi:hypothetical protein
MITNKTIEERVQKLEEENVETSNCLYEIMNDIDFLNHNRQEKTMYNDLTEFERALARFGDKVALIAGLEIADKISPEDAYQQIKTLYKGLKSLRKKEREDWDTD